jgi:hypothetical protein
MLELRLRLFAAKNPEWVLSPAARSRTLWLRGSSQSAAEEKPVTTAERRGEIVGEKTRRKKSYRAPRVESERVEVGVFGSYSGTSGPVANSSASWLFGLCCEDPVFPSVFRC